MPIPMSGQKNPHGSSQRRPPHTIVKRFATGLLTSAHPGIGRAADPQTSSSSKFQEPGSFRIGGAKGLLRIQMLLSLENSRAHFTVCVGWSEIQNHLN